MVIAYRMSDFAEHVRSVPGILRVSYDEPANSITTIFRTTRWDLDTLKQISAIEQRCLQHMEAPLTRFDAINLADFDDDLQPEIVRQYQGTTTLYAA